MKLSIAICDDEQNQIEYIRNIVSEWTEEKEYISVFSEFSSAIASYADSLSTSFEYLSLYVLDKITL